MFVQGSAITNLTDGSLLLFRNVFIFRWHWVSVAALRLSLVVERGSLSLPRGGFSRCKAQAPSSWLQQLWCAGSALAAPGLSGAGAVVVAHGLSCSGPGGSFPGQRWSLCLLG